MILTNTLYLGIERSQASSEKLKCIWFALRLFILFRLAKEKTAKEAEEKKKKELSESLVLEQVKEQEEIEFQIKWSND